jgi:hypothetical protein
MNRVLAEYIRTEKFSNKNFFIEIKLYEGGLATAGEARLGLYRPK